MASIYLKNEDKTIEANVGNNLYAVLCNNNIIDAPCGGKGICGKCRVTVDNTSVLSCLYTVKKDITVITPPKTKISPIVSKGYCKEFEKDKFSNGEMGIAIDIGTTTVVASLVDLSSGREVVSLSTLNSQKAYGQDVITRIHYQAENENGIDTLKKIIVNDLTNLISGIYQSQIVKQFQIKRVTIGANTTMIHLLLGEKSITLAQAPYKPAFDGAVKCSNKRIPIPVNDECEIYCLPAISAFVGGDITAGILACNLKNNKESVLLIDIGTNGEIVLSRNGKLCCCSCAAGPALEGMNISCGMRAAEGAIDDITITDKEISYKTIGNKEALGICGSGLLSAISEMVKKGYLKSSGRFADSKYVKRIEGKNCFVIDDKRNIYITQSDIRQVQLAKGAILSGIKALLEHEKITEFDVKEVLVAGQFGAHLKSDSLTFTGILPSSWNNKIKYVGNTSKSGAYICLLSQEECNMCEHITNKIDYLELSTLQGYDNLFIKCLNFDMQ